MVWPTAPIPTNNLDASTDSPALARPDLLQQTQQVNQMQAHVSAFAATLLDDANAAAARATLGGTAVGGGLFTAADVAAARTLLEVVALTGNQTVGGVKTYTGSQRFTSASATSGYGVGAGLTVTQPTSKTTNTPAFNRPCGYVITHGQSLAAGASVEFSVPSTLAFPGESVVVINPTQTLSYTATASVVTGGFGVRLTNITGGALAEAVTLSVSILRISTT
jgi:hypothetical protein